MAQSRTYKVLLLVMVTALLLAKDISPVQLFGDKPTIEILEKTESEKDAESPVQTENEKAKFVTDYFVSKELAFELFLIPALDRKSRESAYSEVIYPPPEV